MSATGATSGEHRPELPTSAYVRMAAVLRGGLLLALVILAAGIAVYCATHLGTSYTTVVVTNPIRQYLGFLALARGLASGTVEAYLTLGVLVLVATPILRVVTGSYYFHRDGERTMTAITLVVLALLLFGILFLGPLIR